MFLASTSATGTVADGRDNGWRTTVFEAGDLAALRPEPHGLPIALLRRQLRTSIRGMPTKNSDAFADWASVGAWYRGLREIGVGLGDELYEPVQGAVLATGTDVVPMVAAFRFVRDNIRYVAAYEGLGAFRPHAPDEILRNGYGDCKDMAGLLVAIYRRMGIDAYPALIGTRGLGVFDESFTAVSAFNHVIVALPSEQG